MYVFYHWSLSLSNCLSNKHGTVHIFLHIIKKKNFFPIATVQWWKGCCQRNVGFKNQLKNNIRIEGRNKCIVQNVCIYVLIKALHLLRFFLENIFTTIKKYNNFWQVGNTFNLTLWKFLGDSESLLTYHISV